MEIIKGDLIQLAKMASFDVIGHCANCFCVMKKGIAPLMNKAFECNNPAYFSYENKLYSGDIRKLGQIQSFDFGKIIVVNMYGQFHWKTPSVYGIPLDYDALKVCLRKVNYIYSGKIIGLPGIIGCGNAGGDHKKVIELIETELKDCRVKMVFIDENKIPDFLK